MVRIRRQLNYNDLTGGINNVNSVETINSTPRRTETPEMENVEYFKLGGIKSMEGNTLIGTKQSSAIIGGWEYVKGNNKYLLIGLENGEVKEYNGVTSDFDLIYKFPSRSPRMSFCNMNNGVVITNGRDDLVFYEKGRHQILSGTVATTQGSKVVTGVATKFTIELHHGDNIYIDNTKYIVDTIENDTTIHLIENAEVSAQGQNIYLGEISQCNAVLVNEEDENINTPIRGLAIQYYNGRLWVGTDNGLFYSQVGLYNGWDIHYDAGVLYGIYNDSSEIRALGLYSDYLLIHKEWYTYILTCTGDATTIQVNPYSSISCDSQQSFIQCNAKYYVYSQENMDIYPLTQRSVFSDKYLGEPITQKVRNIFTNLRSADTDKIFAVRYPKKRWMAFYLPMVDSLGSGYALIFDFQTKSFMVRNIPQEVTIAFNYNNNIYVGTSDGLLLKEFTGTSFITYNNGEWKEEPIKAYYKSPWFDWSDGYSQSFAEFAIELAEDSTNEFYIRTFKDGGIRHEDRVISSENPLEPALVWDGLIDEELQDNTTLWDEDVWVNSGFNHIRMLLPNNVFDKFQLEIGTNQEGQAFSIYGYGFRRIETEEEPW